MHKKIALIDGYGFVFRAYHSLPPLTRPDGTPVGAVYGFTNMLIKLLAGLDVTHAAIAFDSGSKTFRNEIYPAYKANRPPCPEDLKPQFPIIRETAESLNLAILEKIGIEADDIIATIAKKSAAEGYEVLIISSDKDLMQLVDGNIFMYDAMKNKFIGEKEVEEKFMVKPNQVLDLLSLIGDSSDNVPGVKGIGPKTAAELILQFGNLENIFTNLDQIKQEKRRQLLSDGAEKAKLSKTLITLKEDVELGINLDDLKIQSIDPYKLISFLEIQGFNSLISRVKKEFSITENNNFKAEFKSEKTNPFQEKSTRKIPFSEIKKIKISNQEIIDELVAKATRNGLVTIDYNKKNDELDFITISTHKTNEEITEIFFSELSSKEITSTENQNLDLFNFEEKPAAKHENSDFIWNGLEKILADNSLKKVFFDAKNFLKALDNFTRPHNKCGVTNLDKTNMQCHPTLVAGSIFIAFDDISLINHLLNSSIKNNLRELIDMNLDEDIEARGFGEIFAEIEKNQEVKNFSDNEKKIEFFNFRNFAINQLYRIFYPQIFSLKLNTAYHSYDKPLLEVLAEIENNGIKIDVEKLHQLSHEFGKKISDLSAEIYALAGCEFNIASTQQLSDILFNKLGLASSKKSKKTGAFSTGVGVLEELYEDGHEIAKKILEFRKFSKLKNTYTDSLPKEINAKTGRIHTNLSSISTITGRLSSRNPNLQNIPIKTIEGRKIRQSFISEKNHLLISADYSQIELRVIAHVAKIENLIAAFKAEKDIHKITASEVFKIPENEIDENLRSKAKAINFGIIYGISAFGLARQLDISRQEASDYIKSYLETYPGIDAYMKNYITFARQNGYVETISGRKCFIREISNKNPAIRSEAERLAINAPIQGSAADIIKKAMINLHKKLRAEKLKSKIILQIHDELLIESPKEEVEFAADLVKSEMENVMVFDVPLKVDVKVGNSWS